MSEDPNNRDSRRLPQRRGWRWFVQFNLRTLLLIVTAAAVGCWWFLQPKTREEQLGMSPLRMRRQVRVVKFEEPKQTDIRRPAELYGEVGKLLQIVNDGRWRLYDSKGNLLVDGLYKSDLAHGKWRIYHANGRKAAEGKLSEGRKVGLWRTWDEEGRVIGDAVYPAGEQGNVLWDDVIPRLPRVP